MSTEKYLEEMRSIQASFLEFIEDDENIEENFQNLCFIFDDQKIGDNKHDLRLFLHYVASVSANHHRSQSFFSKIERVFQIFKEEINKYYLNSEIFDIFKRNKRILLFLIEEKMIIFDEYVARTMIKPKYVKKKYPQYFAPEIKPFMKEKWFPKYNPNSYTKNEWVEETKKELPANFHELRKIGENESDISKLIRDDNAKDFVVYVNQNDFPLKRRIALSIYETNSFLIKKSNESNNEANLFRIKNNDESNNGGIALIEYAAFFGAIQIIKYLQREGEEISPSLWIHAIHSENAELIHFLEDCNVEPTVTVSKNSQYVEKISYKGCVNESIKCSHNAIADYFFSNYLQDYDQISDVTFIQSLKYYNFAFIQTLHLNESSFFLFCAHDYYFFVDDLLTNKNINTNSKLIQNHII